jgi:beta-glucanase (GH16 family)
VVHLDSSGLERGLMMDVYAGFEYWSDPKQPGSGYVTWQVDGVQSARVGAGAMGPDMGTDGSQIGQRLIPLEPMSIVLNLGISSALPLFLSAWGY